VPILWVCWWCKLDIVHSDIFCNKRAVCIYGCRSRGFHPHFEKKRKNIAETIKVNLLGIWSMVG
jgi:hypothetical protein